MKAVILLFYFLSSSCFAFTLTNARRVKLPEPDVKIVVASNVCNVAGFNSGEEFAEMVKESMDEYWNRIPTCRLELEVEGVDSSIDTTSDTLGQAIAKAPVGKILVGCSNDTTELFGSTGTLGVGSINTATGDRGVLLINNAATTFANLSKQEKLATIAHEIGHAIGLGHSEDPAALMYYAIGGKIQEKLSIDDYDGCSWLYPHDAPGGCSSLGVAPIGKGGPGSKRILGSEKKSSNPFYTFTLFACAFTLTLLFGYKSSSLLIR